MSLDINNITLIAQLDIVSKIKNDERKKKEEIAREGNIFLKEEPNSIEKIEADEDVIKIQGEKEEDTAFNGTKKKRYIKALLEDEDLKDPEIGSNIDVTR